MNMVVHAFLATVWCLTNHGANDMTTRPLIGLPGRRKAGRDVAGMLTTFADMQIDLYFANYAKGVIAAGGLPVHLPIDVDPLLIIDRLDGLLLTGGTDIEPSLYGAESETDIYPPEPERDDLELGLFKGAVHRQIPVLGICRGQQIVNVGAGGTLHQDVPPHSGVGHAADAELHEVTLEPDSILRELYGASVWVNSLHHQAVDTVGEDLRVTGWSADDVAEGLEHTSLPIVCVQWHPEMMPTRDTDPIFSWLVEAAGRG
ncbi:MAG: gamma-glutamyl-gamma-aminobutyrate hydrolase family protein [Acidimicrobiaceae bacterium]|nr:gamma-glutamyl-gamma-aminobutyrate hydrolase family protein [Acidimicrobiaceae bacterium]